MRDPIFILGCHKSGTTLLRALLDGHKDLFVFPCETHFFQYSNFWVDYNLRRNTPKTNYSSKNHALEYINTQNNSSDPFSDSSGFKGYNTEMFVDKFMPSDNDCLRDNLVNYWESLAYALGNEVDFSKKRLVEKSVENAEYAGVLQSAFPKSKFVHILRNPYATLVATRKMKSNNGYPFLGPIIKSMWNSYYYLYKNPSQINNYLVIRYEDLLEDPKQLTKKICAFLGLEFDNNLLTPTVSRAPWKGNSTSKKKFSTISKEPLYSWQNDIFPLEVSLINNAFSHVLEKYEYRKMTSAKSWIAKNKKESFRLYMKNRIYYKWFSY